MAQYYLATSGNIVIEGTDTNCVKVYFGNIDMEAPSVADNEHPATFRSSGVINL